MSDLENCCECGKRLPLNLPGGQCPACLLRRGFEPITSENDAAMLSETQIVSHSSAPPTDVFQTKKTRPLHPDDRFGEYRIVKRLGQGGMGTVYEADHLTSGRRVALKVLSHSLDSKESRNRFLREGRLAAAINHENSVYVFGTEEIEGIPTISMELIAGGTLASQVRKFGAMSVQRAVDSILQVILGLEAAEKKGVLHRDIKPANCFVDRNGQVKIGDFGLSISNTPTELNAASNMTQEGVFLGTPAFASPEQLRGEQLDQRSDIYAVGVTLFYLLTGKPPFEGKNLVQLLATVLDKSPPNVTELNAEVPVALSRVIDSCLAKSSGSRPPSYSALRERLGPFGSHTPQAATLEQRFVAGLLDVFVLGFLAIFARAIILQFVIAYEVGLVKICATVTNGIISLGYFAICESQYGMTVGKRIIGLRVSQDGHHPSVSTALIRSSIYDATTRIPLLVGAVSLLVMYGEQTAFFDPDYARTVQVFDYLYYIGFALTAAMFLPLWKSKDQPAFHDRLTDTRVTVVSPAVTTEPQNQPEDAFITGDSERAIGPYVVLASLREDNGESTLLAYDTKLLRRVWVRTRQEYSPEVSNADRNLSRPGRLRWLGGCRGTENWDCYEAPDGRGLTGTPQPSWEDGRQLIQHLTEELACSLRDGALPKTLSLQNLWADSGSVKLLPFCTADASNDSNDEVIHVGNTADEQEAACIRFVAQLTEYVTKDRVGHDTVSVPLSCRPHLIGLRAATSLTQTQEITDALQRGHAVVSRTRRLCLLLITFSLPIAWALNGLVDRVILSPHPVLQIQGMCQAIQGVKLQERLQHRRTKEDQARSVAAVKAHFAREYRDMYDDTTQWNSSWAKTLISPDDRSLVDSIMAEPEPSANQLPAATDEGAKYGAIISLPLNQIPYYMLMWAQYFWIPSLLAAVFLRGGWLVRSLGVAFVDQHGFPASRVRLLWRAFLPAIPLLIAVAAAKAELGYQDYYFYDLVSAIHFYDLLSAKWTNGAFTVVVTVLLIWTGLRKRFLSDFLSGCYLVPR